MISGRKQPNDLDEWAMPVDDAELHRIGATVVIAPHPDDESLGSGGTLIRLRQLRYPVHVLFVSDGSLSHPHSPTYPAERLRDLREAEAREALRRLSVGAEAATFLRYKDRQVPMPDSPAFAQAVERLVQELNRLQPTTVLVPWRRDPHPDHRASWHILTAAVAQLTLRPRVLEYPIWLWELGKPEDRPRPAEMRVWRVDIRAVFDQRQRAIAAHRSQVTRLIDDDPTAFYLSPELLAHFAEPRELFLEEP